MTPDNLKDLAHDYGDLADDFVAWRAAHAITDPAQGEQFDDQVADLVEKSNKLENLAVTEALANLQTSAADLKVGTQKARHALVVIKDVTKVLAIGAAAVGVVASLLAPAVTAGAVAGALGGLVDAVQKSTTPATPPAGQGSNLS